MKFSYIFGLFLLGFLTSVTPVLSEVSEVSPSGLLYAHPRYIEKPFYYRVKVWVTTTDEFSTPSTGTGHDEKETVRVHILHRVFKVPEETTRSNESLKAIEAAIQTLPHKLRFPFIFCILEGNSYDACAEVLKTNRKTVETRIYRARKQLREALSELFQEV